MTSIRRGRENILSALKGNKRLQSFTSRIDKAEMRTKFIYRRLNKAQIINF
jgi:hypothetical protein